LFYRVDLEEFSAFPEARVGRLSLRRPLVAGEGQPVGEA